MMSPQVAIQRLGHRLKIDESFEIQHIRVCEEYFGSSYSIRVTYTIVIFLLVYIVPVSIITFSYGAIGIHLWRRQPLGELPPSSKDYERQVIETKSILRMIITIVLFFIIAWMPFFTIQLYFLFHPLTDNAFEVFAIFQLVGYSNVCVNPVVYCFLNKKFRICVKSLFKIGGKIEKLRGSRHKMRRLSSVSTKVAASMETSNSKPG